MKTVSLSTSVPGIVYKNWDDNNKKLTIKTTTNSTNDIILQGGYLESKRPINDSTGLELAFIMQNNFYYKILSNVNIISIVPYTFGMLHNTGDFGTMDLYYFDDETTTWEKWIDSPYNDGKFTIDETTNRVKYNELISIWYSDKDGQYKIGCYKTDYIFDSTMYGVNDILG